MIPHEIDKQTKKDVLDKILYSKTFQDVQNYQELLSYLVKLSLSGQKPKETTVAIDFFGRDHHFNPAEDTTVRYHILKLRKKIDQYYDSEGMHDKIRLTIPKGAYKVDFVEQRKNNLNPLHKINFKKLNLALLIGFLLLLIINVYLFYNHSSHSNLKNSFINKSSIWSSFTNWQDKTTIIFGDYYTFRQKRLDNIGYQIVRNYDIDNDSDFEEFKKKNPNKDILKTEFNMLPHHSTQNLIDLLPILQNFENIECNVSSAIDWSDLVKSNVIYLGKLFDLRILHVLISDLNIKYDSSDFIYIIENSDTLETFSRYRDVISTELVTSNYYNRDYAIVTKRPGPNNTSIIIIAGFGHISMIETVRYLTNPNTLNQFEEIFKDKYNIVPEYFESLFEVSGFKRTGLQIKLKYINKLSSTSPLVQ